MWQPLILTRRAPVETGLLARLHYRGVLKDINYNYCKFKLWEGCIHVCTDIYCRQVVLAWGKGALN